MTGTAPTQESKCPTCHGNTAERCTTYGYSCRCQSYVPYKRCKIHDDLCTGRELCRDPWHESKQEWCVTTAKRAFVNARAEQLDAEIVSESKPTSEQIERKGFTRDDDGNEVHFTKRMVTIKPTSEGARTLAEKLWLYSLDSVQAFVTIIPNPENHSSAIDEMAKSIENFAAPFRSQLAAAEKERDTAIAEVGKANRALGYAEYEAQRLRERIAELEGSK